MREKLRDKERLNHILEAIENDLLPLKNKVLALLSEFE